MHAEFLYCTCQKSFIYPQFVIPNKSHVNKKNQMTLKHLKSNKRLKFGVEKLTHSS